MCRNEYTINILHLWYMCAIIVIQSSPVFGPYFNHTDEAYILHTKASYRLANLLVSRDTYPSSNSIILRREHGDLGSHLHMPYVFGTYKGTHRRYACLSTPHAVLGGRSTSSQTPWHPGHLTSKSQANLTIITSRKNKGAWEKVIVCFFFQITLDQITLAGDHDRSCGQIGSKLCTHCFLYIPAMLRQFGGPTPLQSRDPVFVCCCLGHKYRTPWLNVTREALHLEIIGTYFQISWTARPVLMLPWGYRGGV